MKTKILFLCILCFNLAYAGTPAMDDTSILYGIVLLLLGILIGTPYLVKFIKNKMKAKRDEIGEMINSENSSN